MITLFPEGGSYTGEETVEISCHGGVLVSKSVLEVLFKNGATPADKGEFTKRAFINGRLSLTEAEAIANLLEAKSQEQIKLASSTARDRLKKEIDFIRRDLTDILSSIYARIDYPDEDLGEFTDEDTVKRLLKVNEKISLLISTYRTGKAINEGINTVIAGKTNVGKSTLYNLLLGEDAAIVTDIEGTTRDVLERSVPLGRVLLNLCDTAGIRESSDVDHVEKIGIERSRTRITSSDLVFAVFDLSRPSDESDTKLITLLKDSSCAKICILNKSDCEIPSWDGYSHLSNVNFDETVKISVKENAANTLSILSTVVDKLFTDEKISASSDAIISSARQSAALSAAKGFIDCALEGYAIGLPTDAASSDIEMALGAIGELDGRAVSEDVVADIFSKFCVGK
jgi:tRNA modification GTPase